MSEIERICRDVESRWRESFDQLEAERDLLREALEFCRDTSDDEQRARVANAALDGRAA